MKTSTSFLPGQKTTGRKLGSKNKRTVLKEQVGINNWEQLEYYLLNEGTEKLIESMNQLKPGQFVTAYIGLLEYVKPKLSRQNLSTGINGDEQPIQITLDIEGN